MRLTDEIYRIDGVNGVNAYAVRDGDGVMLVDTGIPGNAGRILGFLDRLGYRPADIHTIVLTHGDTDHIGNVEVLKEASGATVAIHEADAPALAGRAYDRGTRGLASLIVPIVAKVMGVRHLEPDVILHDGDTIAGWRVRSLPGHTLGSIVLERGGVAFTGDTVLGDRDGRPQMPHKGLAYDHPEALDSAHAILDSGYTLVLPGHGEPIRA